MVANSIQKHVFLSTEAAFADATSPDWENLAAPLGLMAVTSLEDAALRRAYIEDKTLKTRASGTRSMIRALRSGATASLASYMYGASAAHAAAGSQAVRDILDVLLRSWLGGETDGFSADITGGTAANPDVAAAQGDNFTDWSWGYFWDADGGDGSGEGHFRQIASVADGGGGDDTFTMVAGHDLPFVPAAGDRVYAAKDHWPHWTAMEDHTDALHETLTLLLQGFQTDDVYELKGVKPSIDFNAIEQGSPVELAIALGLAYFLVNPGQEDGSGLALQGSPGRVVGAGSTTRCFLANADAALAAQQFWGGLKFTPGIQYEQVNGPNGVEGVHGWGLQASSYDAGRVEAIVPYDAAFRAEAESNQAKHMLIQVGNAITSAPYGFYFPHLEYADDMEPGNDRNARRQSTLRYSLHERTGVDTAGMTVAEQHQALAKFHILRVG